MPRARRRCRSGRRVDRDRGRRGRRARSAGSAAAAGTRAVPWTPGHPPAPIRAPPRAGAARRRTPPRAPRARGRCAPRPPAPRRTGDGAAVAPPGSASRSVPQVELLVLLRDPHLGRGTRPQHAGQHLGRGQLAVDQEDRAAAAGLSPLTHDTSSFWSAWALKPSMAAISALHLAPARQRCSPGLDTVAQSAVPACPRPGSPRTARCCLASGRPWLQVVQDSARLRTSRKRR